MAVFRHDDFHRYTAEELRIANRVAREGAGDLISIRSSLKKMAVLRRYLALMVDQLPPAEVNKYNKECYEVSKALKNLEEDAQDTTAKICLQFPLVSSGGRPKLAIPAEFMVDLYESGCNQTDVARVCGVSTRTIRRRIVELNLKEQVGFSSISDNDLHQHIRDFIVSSPESGYRMVHGYLRSKGINIARSRIRDAMIQVDSEGVARRLRYVVIRRPYSVPSPRALYHIDGNHKLNKYGFVVHAGIDGFSSKIIFAKVSTNNRADTMLAAFLEGIKEHGLPSRIRIDGGGENIQIAEFMWRTKGVDRGSVIVGPSVHNSKIERWWRDLGRGKLKYFKRLFKWLEKESLYHKDRLDQKALLHFVFLPRLQMAVDDFVQSWNNHRMETKHGKSPNAAWILGMLDKGIAGVDPTNLTYFGVDFEEMGLGKPQPDSVIVDDDDPAFQQYFGDVLNAIDPVGADGNAGVDIYNQCKILTGFL